MRLILFFIMGIMSGSGIRTVSIDNERIQFFISSTVLKTMVYRGLEHIYGSAHPIHESPVYNPMQIAQYGEIFYCISYIMLKEHSLQDLGLRIVSNVGRAAGDVLWGFLQIEKRCYKKLQKYIPPTMAWFINQALYCSLQHAVTASIGRIIYKEWEWHPRGIVL
jgi:hypothetical protein